MNQSRLVVVDDHPEIREAICQLLKPHFEVVADVGDGEAALEAVDRHGPDVVLLDISMPGMSGLEVARHLRQRRPEVHVVFVTTCRHREYVEEAFRIGARGYVLKQAASAELPLAVWMVLGGSTYRSPAIP